MRRIVRILSLSGLVFAAAPILAQEDLRIDETKLYVSDPKACAALEDKGVDAWMDMDFLSFSLADGIQSMEFHCNFYDVKTRKGSTHFFIDAICELPGEIYPDILAVTPYSETEIQVASASDIEWAREFDPADGASADTNVPTGTTIYTRCDNLSEIPFD